MKKLSLFGATLFSSLLASHAHGQSARRKLFDEIVNQPVVLTVPGMDRVSVTADIRYSAEDDAKGWHPKYITPDNEPRGPTYDTESRWRSLVSFWRGHGNFLTRGLLVSVHRGSH